LIKRFATVLSAAALLMPLQASADFVGLYIGVGAWDQSPNGNFQYQGDSLDVEDDLHLGGDSEVYGWIALEHPVPVLPNIRLSGANQLYTGSGTVSRSFTYGGQTYNVSDDIDSRIRLDQRDATFYYELLDNVVSLDLGLDVKYVDGEADVSSSSSGNQSNTTFNAYIPMLYGRVGGDLPFTGLSADVSASAVAYSGNRLVDASARIAYETKFRLGIEGGYRIQQLKLDDVDGVTTDINLEGPFLGVFLHL
jgi:outer membrane protein